MIFDSHAHYDDGQFDMDRNALLSEILPAKGVSGIINMASDLKSIPRVLELTEKYDYIYGGIGIHPECAGNLPENYLEIVENALRRRKIVAVGEIGLDYYYEDMCPKEKQKDVFASQLALAAKFALPVVVHDREAHGDTLNILREHRPQGVVHCFSGSAQTALEVTRLGMYIGIGGVVTFKNARHIVEVAESIPLNRLLLETDCPYLAPVPMRGKRNDSSLIAYSAAKIAEIRGISAQEVLNASRDNIKALFGI